MLHSKGFDLWADGYDTSVGLSDENGTYPFAGYKALLNAIYGRILQASSKTILDIGFGTGTLAYKLYQQGCAIYGQDFSEKMIHLAQTKMPDAQLFRGDFSKGLVPGLTQRNYDAIVATYSLHHLTDEQKTAFLKDLLPRLKEGGCLYIGDVAFETRAALQECKKAAGDAWDDDEIYFVFDEIRASFPSMQFEKFSPCAGLITLRP